MSNSSPVLKAAVQEFVHRSWEEQVTPDQLRDVIDELECELDMLYEPDPGASRAEAEALAKQFVEQLRRRAKADSANAIRRS